MKAYQVDEGEPGEHSELLFAERNNFALLRRAASLFSGDVYSISARRAPWADGYSNASEIPVIVAVEAGWSFECNRLECRSQISQCAIDDGQSPVGFMTAAYCSKECADTDTGEKP